MSEISSCVTVKYFLYHPQTIEIPFYPDSKSFDSMQYPSAVDSIVRWPFFCCFSNLSVGSTTIAICPTHRWKIYLHLNIFVVNYKYLDSVVRALGFLAGFELYLSCYTNGIVWLDFIFGTMSVRLQNILTHKNAFLVRRVFRLGTLTASIAICLQYMYYHHIICVIPKRVLCL